ncbi:TRAP transporter small permease [Aquibium carbonis]|uniref:TRAP transporter small permease protein n=1 Tax=Aquibium carbonis TaxID=2495581 RepID=A0A3R9YG57_9HYPH|nr:TRAP transporter small permease [Aquibium carbonis]RST86857.1 TRAP transporter small permease [Aquibium carbonis]
MTHGATPEPADGSGWGQRIRATADTISNALNVIGTLLILGLVVLVNADVLGRNLFLAPISGVPEIVSMSIVAIVFLQVSQAFRMGRFTRTDALLNALGSRAPRLRAAVELVYVAAALALVWFLLSASWPLFEKAWQRGTYVGTVGDFTAPEWPVKLVILIGCMALIMQMLIAGAIALWGIVEPKSRGDAR